MSATITLPGELIAKTASFLDLSDVKKVVMSFVGNCQMVECIRNEYLEGNLHYLLMIQQIENWETRKLHTLTWMKYNNWKAIFHEKGNLSDCIKEMYLLEKLRKDPLFTHDCCKPFTDIFSSVERGIVEITEYLITRGSCVNEQKTIDNLHFEQNHRPLNVALTLPSIEMLLFLLSTKNIEVDYPFQSTFGNSVVHFAAADESVSVEHLETFLRCLGPTNINGRDTIGKTPLHYVCWFLPSEYEAKAELLLKHGANVNAFGNDFQDPLQILQHAGRHRQKNIDSAEVLLKQYGAIEIRVGP